MPKICKAVLKVEKMKQLFPKNESQHLMEKRCPEFYKVVRMQTERFKKSAIPSMLKMLNSYHKKQNETFRKLDAVPVNNVYHSLYHCDINKL